MNSKFLILNSKFKGFTLVELLLVVSILGILAAIALPEFQGHIQQAKEAAAKDNLRILREAIERYAADHNGVPPGYPSDNPANNPGVYALNTQFFNTKYFQKRPENPFSALSSIQLIGNAEQFPAAAATIELYGWVYQPATKTIRLNWEGADSQGRLYYSY